MRRLLPLAAAAAIALIAGVWAAAVLLAPPEPPETRATLIAEGNAIPDFELVDHRGEPFDPARLEDRWTFLFFGFTHCPDICPMTLYVLDEAVAELDGEPPQVVFVTVDPERDTPEQLARYVPYFNDDFIGVTGAPEAIEALTRGLGIVAVKHDDEAGEGFYSVDHSATVLLVNPEGQVMALFPAPHRAAPMAEDFSAIRDFWRRRG